MTIINFLVVFNLLFSSVGAGYVETISLPVKKTYIPASQLMVHPSLTPGQKKEPESKVTSVVGAKPVKMQDYGVGKATYYGWVLAGRRTSSGDIFDPNKYTAAAIPAFHFGDRLKVTNVANGKSVIVTVNDRGAFASRGVTLDLSQGAFGAIAPLSQGVVHIRIEKIVQ